MPERYPCASTAECWSAFERSGPLRRGKLMINRLIELSLKNRFIVLAL
jgi:hypothetical protein